MARFTERAKDGNIFFPKCFEKCHGVADGSQCANCDHYDRMLKKFAEYEDLEEQGLILRLPCKKGDTVYLINSAIYVNEKISKDIVADVEMRCGKILVRLSANGYVDGASFGEELFFSYEDACKKLEA